MDFGESRDSKPNKRVDLSADIGSDRQSALDRGGVGAHSTSDLVLDFGDRKDLDLEVGDKPTRNTW